MTAAEIIRQVRSGGGQIAADGAALVLTAPPHCPPDLLDRLKAHKPGILAALACSRRRPYPGPTRLPAEPRLFLPKSAGPTKPRLS